jgi:hypothetical protein
MRTNFSTRRRTITTERHELFLVVGAALGRVPRPATGLLAGEHHEGRDDATRRAGPAGLIFCCGSSALHHDSGRLSKRPTVIPLHGLGLAGQPRARRSEQNGGVLGAACGAIMLRTPPIRSGRGNDLAGAASKGGGRGKRTGGRYGRRTSWGLGQRRQAHLLADQNGCWNWARRGWTSRAALFGRWLPRPEIPRRLP